MKFLLSIVSLMLIVASLPSCNASISQTAADNSIDNASVVSRSAVTPLPIEDPEALCRRLRDLVEIPYYYDESSDDPIYNGLIQAGNTAIPCLIDEITDTTPMHYPGPGTIIVQDYRVGDAAMFMLLYITKQEWQPETMLPPEYAARWERDGMFAYFAFVEKPENRKRIQGWWRKWMKNKGLTN